MCDATHGETVLGIYEPDGNYHFISVNSGQMKVVDKNGRKSAIRVEKGTRYFNPDPVQHPCDWAKTTHSIVSCTTEQVDSGDCPEDKSPCVLKLLGTARSGELDRGGRHRDH